jgi:nicotinate phosphoribosyltransferase
MSHDSPQAALYRPSLGLLTDLYQLTMAYGYWRAGRQSDEAIFHLYFRKAPFGGSFAVAAGLGPALDFLTELRFERADIEYLRGLVGADGRPLFEAGFLDYLWGLRFTCDVDAIPEGDLVFPHEPLLRVKGSLIEAQLVETALLTILNFQTLVATKAARVALAAEGAPVLEFGLRRAQGIDGGLSASRAAYVGGCASTSNVLAGRLYGIPVRGTHAHSWVLAHDSEVEAFERYAEALPNNCIFLVDTYDTLTGVDRAIEVGRKLRAEGHEMLGVRLDSGDLGALARAARERLDAAGFPNAKVVASNDLDEHRIAALRKEGAPIGIYGVGTRLVTGGDQSALGGVYKLSAVRRAGGAWQQRVKRSEEAAKISLPGEHQVRRYALRGQLVGDLLYDVPTGIPECPSWRSRGGEALTLPMADEERDLLVPALRGGERVAAAPSLSAVRDHAAKALQSLPDRHRRLEAPEPYLVGVEGQLSDTTHDLLRRGGAQ